MTSCVALSVLSVSAFAKDCFDKEWKFALGDFEGGERVEFDDRDWSVLDVPHDWSVEGEYRQDQPMGDRGGYLPAGIGWYRKTISVPKDWSGKRIEIAFDGIFRKSVVWANGVKLGERPYGWISFAYDLTDIVEDSDTLTIAVRVDNELQPAARWYSGSGIYGHALIIVKEPVHVANDGVWIRSEGDRVFFDTEISNTSSVAVSASLNTIIQNSEGDVVDTVSTVFRLDANERQAVKQSIVLENAMRWSPDSPSLYTAVSELKIGDKTYESSTKRFGLRDISWVPETGMWIDGKNVKLRGVCNHQEAGAFGAAVPDKILRFRIEQLKKMGANAIRVSHNPQTPIFYELCDELGMFVLDEIFDGWSQKALHDYGRYHFDEWWRRDVEDWIKRDRSHPSVIAWSVGNETHGEIAKDLVAFCHELDPNRLVTSGNSERQYMDIYGANGGSERKGFFESLAGKPDFGEQVFIGTENPHTWQVRGYYRTKSWFRDGYPNPKRGPHEIPDLTEEEIFTYDWTEAKNKTSPKQFFNSSYDNATVRVNVRQSIEQLRDIPFYAGSFRWTGHDYFGEAGFVHGGWPFKAFMGGVVDLANFEKDHYYLYQSQWTEEPMLHVLPHWTHPVMERGTGIPVWAYTNCDSVELFLNGRSLGRRSPGKAWDEMQCDWIVGWEPGELKAVAYQDGKVVLEKVVRSAEAPSRIKLSIDGEALAESGEDLVQVRVAAVDTRGTFYPYGENRSYFHVLGPGEIDSLDNGSPIDVESYYGTNNRIAFFGLTRAYVRSRDAEGDISLLAGCILGEKKLITSNLVHIDTQLIALRGELLRPRLEVFYTTDGSEPTTDSERYTAGFEVGLGTTVKALVLVDGKPTLRMQERFASDVGFVWDNGEFEGGSGEQAELAWIRGGTVRIDGEGFNGSGFVDLGDSEDSYVEWYQENDGAAGEFELLIRCSGQRQGGKDVGLKLSINETAFAKRIEIVGTENPEGDWQTVKLNVPLGRGANYIRISPVGGGHLFLDEISLR